MANIEQYMKDYSSAYDTRSKEQKNYAREVQSRVKRTIYQNTRFNHVKGGISPKKFILTVNEN